MKTVSFDYEVLTLTVHCLYFGWVMSYLDFIISPHAPERLIILIYTSIILYFYCLIKLKIIVIE